MKEKELYTVKIQKQDHFGNGIAKIDDFIVFVDGVLPGDLCRIEITKVNKKYANASLVKITSQSTTLRRKAPCTYQNFCGGCHIMHEVPDHQLEFKKTKVEELLRKQLGISIEIKEIVSGEEFNYRNKAVFHGDKMRLGFYRKKSKELVDIDRCKILKPEINDVYKKLLPIKYKIEEVTIRTTSLGQVMVVLTGTITEKELKFEADTIYLNNELIKGNGYIEETINDMTFRIYKDSFFQVNYEIMVSLYNDIIKFFEDNKVGNVLDLYCGTGTIGMLISKYVDKVIGIEEVKSSITSALECKKINKVNNIEFICDKVENKIEEFKDIDAIIVDPPRSGLDEKTTEAIKQIKPKNIIYVSCDPATLARDLKELSGKYEIKKVKCFDMFPNTYHVETCVLLSHKNS